jgi:formylglycine-generating enzyme required for sulfatase activity
MTHSRGLNVPLAFILGALAASDARRPADGWTTPAGRGGESTEFVAGGSDPSPGSREGVAATSVEAFLSTTRIAYATTRSNRPGADAQERSLKIAIPGLNESNARPLTLRRLPGGSFQMGSEDVASNADERPIRSVCISNDYYLGETEITQAQWRAVMGTLPPASNPKSGIGRGNDFPVDSVSWEEVAGADGFIARLNSLTSLAFRLPTEAEWEYACRAGTSTRFYFGDSLTCLDDCADCPASPLSGNRSDYLWYCGNNGFPGSAEYGGKPVGLKKPNSFGLFDMHGNLFEYCSDWYQADFYAGPEAAVPDPENKNPASGRRVIRGGCWDYGATYSRSALRYGARPERPDWGTGFRLALTAMPTEQP